MHATSSAQDSQKMVAVWDPLVRIFHWSLVIGFSFAYVTGDEWDFAHEVLGYAIATLVLVRILWGFVGTRYARFSNFVYRPTKVFAFLRDSLSLKGQRYLGHNPAGGAMIIALITVILGISATGILLTIDAYHEAEWLEEAHEILANGALVLIALHLAGVALASFEHRENLVVAMFTGRKRMDAPDEQAQK